MSILDRRVGSGATQASPNQLAVGEEIYSRDLVTSSAVAVTSGVLRLSFFTALKTEITAQVKMLSGSTPAGATPSLIRVGLYLVQDSGNGVLVASTLNNPTNNATLFTVVNMPYIQPWSTPYLKLAGQRYAEGPLFVTTAAPPTLAGYTLALAMETEAAADPRLTGRLSGQTDLPASFTAGSLTPTNVRYYASLLPL